MYYGFLRSEQSKREDNQLSNLINRGKYSNERQGKRLVSLQNYQVPKNPEAQIPCLPSTLTRHSASLQNLNSRIPTQKTNHDLMKNMLNENYQKQISQKKQEKSRVNRLKLMEERDYLSSFIKNKQFQGLIHNQEKIRYKKQLLTEIQQKKIMIDLIKTEETSIQKIFQQPRQNSLKNKSQAFKRFYQEASKYQNKVQNQYKQYMKLEEVYTKSRNKHKISDYSRNFDLMNRLRNQQIRLEKDRREELKRILDSQIKQKSIKSKQIKQLHPTKSVQIINYRYNPIVNPIDYKIDINNRNLVDQIMKKSKVTNH